MVCRRPSRHYRRRGAVLCMCRRTQRCDRRTVVCHSLRCRHTSNWWYWHPAVTLACGDVVLPEPEMRSDLCFLDSDFAAVVAAFAAYVVVHVPCAAVGADSQCGDKSFVVCTTFRCTGMRLSAFRMCHCFIVLIVIIQLFVTDDALFAGRRCRDYSPSSSASTECSSRRASISGLHPPSAWTLWSGMQSIRVE